MRVGGGARGVGFGAAGTSCGRARQQQEWVCSTQALSGHASRATSPELLAHSASPPLHYPCQGPYRAVGAALEVIPRTLAQNCGANVIRTLTKLRAKHAEEPNCTFGIDGALLRVWLGAGRRSTGWCVCHSRCCRW